MQATLRANELVVGQELPPLDLETTATLVAGGAIASRDYTPVHHDKSAAVAQQGATNSKPIPPGPSQMTLDMAGYATSL